MTRTPSDRCTPVVSATLPWRRLPCTAIVVAAFALPMVGCDVEDESADTQDVVSTSFTTLGSFTLGTDIFDPASSVEVTLPAGGKKHAVTFQGKKGQVVAIDVLLLNGGDLTADLLDPSKKKIASNDDYDDVADLDWVDTNPRFDVTLPKNGKYTVVFREKGKLGGRVIVRGATADGTVAPATSVFDESWCSGTPLTPSNTASMFAAGSALRSLGNATLWQRSRPCTTATGCGAWEEPTKLPLQIRYSVSAIPGTIPLTNTAPIELAVESTDTFSFGLRFFSEGQGTPGATGGRLRCQIGGLCLVDNPSTLVFGKQTFDNFVTLQDKGASVRLTQHCARIAVAGVSETTSGAYVEAQAVWAATF